MTTQWIERASDLAARLMALAPGDNEEAQVALAHVLARDKATSPDAWAAICQRVTTADHMQAMAIACAVLSGRRPDPTGGATRFHLHTENPAWARDLTPKALIGRYFYYAP